MLGKEEIFTTVVLKREKVEIPELGGDVYVSEMTGADSDEWEQSLVGSDGKRNLKNITAKLVVATLVNENGERIFTEDDLPRVAKLPARILNKIAIPADRINGLTGRYLEDVKKN